MVNAYIPPCTEFDVRLWACSGLNQYTKLGLMCLAQGHNAVTSVRLEPHFIYKADSRHLGNSRSTSMQRQVSTVL